MNYISALLAQRKKAIYPKLDAVTAMRTVAMLAVLARTYTVILAAICQTDGEERLALVEKLASWLLKDVRGQEIVAEIYVNLTGKDFDIRDASGLATELPKAWKYHGVDELLKSCVQLGLLDKKDVVNLSWVERSIDRSVRLTQLSDERK